MSAHDLSRAAAEGGQQIQVRWTDRFYSFFRYLLRIIASRLRYGTLLIALPDGEKIECKGSQPGPDAVLILHRWRSAPRLLLDGDIGFAEAYMDGDWSTPDLTALIEIAAINEASLGKEIRGFLFFRLLNRLTHVTSANTRRGSKKNIEYHYDLGNEFYARWLDPGMSYSSALYANPNQSLEQAQENKLDRVYDLLDLKGGESVLEIGCGWGRLAERLVKEHGARVTGLTLSPAQLEVAQARMKREGIESQADLRLQDYRDVQGTFDRIVSIEMFEAVGEKYWPEYFATIRERLASGGRAVLQVINISAERYEFYRSGVDFIQRYIFPGGMLPSPEIMRDQINRAGLTLDHLETFGDSYARTLREWKTRFFAAWPEISKLGFDAKFMRMWEYYLSYCEAGFKTDSINVGLYVLKRP